jgi:single-strand DNA-binding protein
MFETVTTIVGNLVDEPKMRQTESGIEVAGFRIASTSRRYDRHSGEWVDGASVYLGVACWRALGANVCASLKKGDPVIVYGKLQTRQYEKDGQIRSAYELEAFAVGPDLNRGITTFRKMPRSPVPPTYSVTDSDGVPIMVGQGADGDLPAAIDLPPHGIDDEVVDGIEEDRGKPEGPAAAVAAARLVGAIG